MKSSDCRHWLSIAWVQTTVGAWNFPEDWFDGSICSWRKLQSYTFSCQKRGEWNKRAPGVKSKWRRKTDLEIKSGERAMKGRPVDSKLQDDHAICCERGRLGGTGGVVLTKVTRHIWWVRIWIKSDGKERPDQTLYSSFHQSFCWCCWRDEKSLLKEEMRGRLHKRTGKKGGKEH